MHEKLKSLQNHPRIAQLRDVRALGMLAFLAVALMISWSGAQVIQRNYELQKQISQLQQENAVRELENNNLALQNQYLETGQYLELEARQNFGLGQPGETLLMVPKDVALAYAIDTGDEASKVPTPESRRPAYQRNLEAWMDFFLHRQGRGE